MLTFWIATLNGGRGRTSPLLFTIPAEIVPLALLLSAYEAVDTQIFKIGTLDKRTATRALFHVTVLQGSVFGHFALKVTHFGVVQESYLAHLRVLPHLFALFVVCLRDDRRTIKLPLLFIEQASAPSRQCVGIDSVTTRHHDTRLILRVTDTRDGVGQLVGELQREIVETVHFLLNWVDRRWRDSLGELGFGRGLAAAGKTEDQLQGGVPLYVVVFECGLVSSAQFVFELLPGEEQAHLVWTGGYVRPFLVD